MMEFVINATASQKLTRLTLVSTNFARVTPEENVKTVILTNIIDRSEKWA